MAMHCITYAARPGCHLAGRASALVLLLAFPALCAGRFPYLVWSDEFTASAVDTTHWGYDTGTGAPALTGWGNNELEYYTTRPENARIVNGSLLIEARKESYGGSAYTSARMKTRLKGDWTYGRFEIRAKLPRGQGLWPAIWMLPTDNAYGGWAASGEIDIMEEKGQQPQTVLGTIHYGGAWPANQHTGSSYTLTSSDFSRGFHLFALEWVTDTIRWYVDSTCYQTQTQWNSANGAYPAPFNKRFHLILNVAVGGNFLGNPDQTTVFPESMLVDYVRVYSDQQVSAGHAERAAAPRGAFGARCHRHTQSVIVPLAPDAVPLDVVACDPRGRSLRCVSRLRPGGGAVEVALGEYAVGVCVVALRNGARATAAAAVLPH